MPTTDAEKIKALTAAVECLLALNEPTKIGTATLERHGWSYSDRFTLSATEFATRMGGNALRQAWS